MRYSVRDDDCFFKSRYYNAAIGTFIQPDTIVPKVTNPQSLDRYAYVLDNPLKLVDPSGHDPRCAACPKCTT